MPAKASRLLTYRIEEVTLPQPAKVTVGGEDIRVNKAWRITIMGGPFPVRAMPPTIWVGDTLLGQGAESPDLSSITAVTFDGSILVEGAPIALSYGKEGRRMVLPEKLSFGGHLR